MPNSFADRGPRPFSLAKVTATVREMGWRRAFVGTGLFGLRQCRLWWWDRLHDVSTRHRVPLSKLDVHGSIAAHAQFYEGSDTKCLPRLLRRLGVDYHDYVFIDLGTGKGMPMLLAAEFPFKQIIGLEFSASLATIARRNCQSFRSRRQACRQFEVICGDAAEFVFPDAPLVVYMFNPFDEVIVSRVLSNLAASLHKGERDVFLVYYNPSHSEAISRRAEFRLFLEGTDEWDYRKLSYKVYRTGRPTPSAFQA